MSCGVRELAVLTALHQDTVELHGEETNMSEFNDYETDPKPVSLCACCEDKTDLDIHELHQLYRTTYRPRVVLKHNYIMTEHMVATVEMYSSLMWLLDQDLIVRLQNIIPEVFINGTDCSSATNKRDHSTKRMCRIKVTDEIADDHPVPDLCLFRSQLLRVRSYIQSSACKATADDDNGALLDSDTFNLFLMDECLRHIMEDNSLPVRELCTCPTEGLEEAESFMSSLDFGVLEGSGYDPELGYNPRDYSYCSDDERDAETNEDHNDDRNTETSQRTSTNAEANADPDPMSTFEIVNEEELLNSLPKSHFETNVEMGPSILGCNLERPECHPETIYSARDCCHCDLCVTRRKIEDSDVLVTPDDLENLRKVWRAFFGVQSFVEEYAYSQDLSPLIYVEKRLSEMTQEHIMSWFFESEVHSQTDLFECPCKSKQMEESS